MKINNALLSALTLGILLCGCNFKPVTPQKQTSFKADYVSTNVSTQWWKSFNDPQLNALIQSALEQNSDLQTALNNVEYARVNLGLNKLEYLPNVNLSGSAVRQNNFGNQPDRNSHGSYQIGAVLSYEIDFWGRVRNSVDSARSRFNATKYDYETAKNTITSTVATTYFTLLALKQQEKILKDSLKSYQDTQNYRKKQLDAGAVSEIVFYQAKAAVQSAEASLISVQNQLSAAQTSLNILTGKSYDEILRGTAQTAAKMPNAPQIPSGIPSDVILHRPDVASSLENLRSSNFLVGVAKAGYFPTFSLTGSAGYASGEFDRLFTASASTWNIGGSLVGPLLDFGRQKRRVELANLEQNASFIAYDKALKTAFGDVRDALIGVQNAKLRQASLADLVASQSKIYSNASSRYQAGYSDHLEFLDSQRNLLSAQLNKVQTDLDVLSATVNAYKALGGGFSIEDSEIKALIGAEQDVQPDMSAFPKDRIFN